MSMSDEAAVMLRIGIFGILAAIVYWFVSYEWLGTIALLGLGLGPGFIGVSMARMLPPERPGEGLWDTIRRLVGTPKARVADHDPELADPELMVLPAPTIWPFVMSLGFAVGLSGLIFGLWLVLIGGILVVTGIRGWVASVSREHLARRASEQAQATGQTIGPGRR